MNPQLRNELSSVLKSEIAQAQPVSGGDINLAYRIRAKSGSEYFVKSNSDASSQFFQKEAEGLEALRRLSGFRVPQVIAIGERDEQFLVLEWIEPIHPTESSWKIAGKRLAEMHQADIGNDYGWEGDNFIGRLVQKNKKIEDGVAFWRDCRLGPHVELAKEKRLLSSADVGKFERLFLRLPEILSSSGSRPSFLHGDLWSGNIFFAANGEPVLIDPAVYCGNREVEMAFTELFGGFSSCFYESYSDIWHLDEGYAGRKGIWQLYPLLVHLNLFGGSYLGSVMDIVNRNITSA